jgi:hypothetical protein
MIRKGVAMRMAVVMCMLSLGHTMSTTHDLQYPPGLNRTYAWTEEGWA